MNIGIIGGSIAGCSAAILLMRAGHEVTVFERSSKDLVGRGGGIGTPQVMFDQLLDDGLLSRDFAHFHISKMPLVGKSQESEPYGKTAWSIPMDFKVFRWNELWRHLRAKVPDECYKAGVKVTDAKKDGNSVVLSTSEGSSTFDLVLFADGYNSLGRQILFPEKKLRYRGYILWRGLLPESTIEDNRLSDEILRLSYSSIPGHNVVYFIPNADGSVGKGKRVFNWAAYIPVDENDLDRILTGKDGRTFEGSVPPGQISQGVERELKEILVAQIPQKYADVVQATANSYIQVIYTLDLDQYQRDRMCLVGDAGIVVQPFTGSGVFKGYSNVKDLLQSLNTHDSLQEALSDWEAKQLKTGKRLLALGEQMEKAFIWEQLDFATVTEDQTKEWWKASVTFPEDFNYRQSQ